jgi:hypothetical protein
MTKMTKPNDTRAKAEENILKNMRIIRKNLDEHRADQEEPVDKKRVMSVLTNFLKLKKLPRRH